MSSEEAAGTSEELTFDEVQTWRVPALKNYCRLRGLKVSGRKKGLVARVFAASEMKIQVQPTAEERIATTTTEKARLLELEDGAPLPDPESLKDGWKSEDSSITSWPPIYLNDITIFLMGDHPGKDVVLHERLLNEYKEGKAYRLYESGFLKEIFFHPITSDSLFCFLRAKCTHSMSISDTPHKAWIAADKKTGKIVSSYCSCVAGMSSSCIHVTALLFRIEAANKSGQTNPACTSRECVWTVPAAKTVVTPQKICDMTWKASKLNKEPKRPTTDRRRSLFEPVAKRFVSDPSEWRDKLFNGLKTVLPDSSFVLMQTAEHTTEEYRPLSFPVETLLSQQEIADIEQKTVGQADNPLWFQHRKGRITASNFYRVKTKVDSLKDENKTDASAEKLVASLTGSTVPSKDIPALKYGREMESTAKAAYLNNYKQTHKDVLHRECGLFIDESKQFLGASPDLVIECSCCGKGVLEVKCPYSIAEEFPGPANLNYLVNNNGKITLKKNHAYYAQVQGQLAITKREWCDFIVYTQKGYLIEKIYLDRDYWSALEESLEWFYIHHLKPSIK